MQIPDYKFPHTPAELDAQVNETRALLRIALNRLTAHVLDAIRLSPNQTLKIALKLSRLAVSYAIHALHQKSPLYGAQGAINRARMMNWMEGLALEAHGGIAEFESKQEETGKIDFRQVNSDKAKEITRVPSSMADKIFERARANGWRRAQFIPPRVSPGAPVEHGRCMN